MTTSTNAQNSLHHSIPTPASTCQAAGLCRLALVREPTTIPQALFRQKPKQTHRQQISSSGQQNESALESQHACPSEISHRFSKQESHHRRKDFPEHHQVLLSLLPATNRLQSRPRLHNHQNSAHSSPRMSPRVLIYQVLRKGMKVHICAMQTKM